MNSGGGFQPLRIFAGHGRGWSRARSRATTTGWASGQCDHGVAYEGWGYDRSRMNPKGSGVRVAPLSSAGGPGPRTLAGPGRQHHGGDRSPPAPRRDDHRGPPRRPRQDRWRRPNRWRRHRDRARPRRLRDSGPVRRRCVQGPRRRRRPEELGRSGVLLAPDETGHLQSFQCVVGGEDGAQLRILAKPRTVWGVRGSESKITAMPIPTRAVTGLSGGALSEPRRGHTWNVGVDDQSVASLAQRRPGQ